MNGGWFRDVDLDLLADYVGGALDGTPEGETVARLIADEPDWAQAYAELTAATEKVRERLAALGAVDMPPDITARLSEALATAARPARRPARPARSRWAGPATIAAAVTILAGLGITAFSRGDLGWPATAPESETRASTPAVVAPPTERVFASGTNYARADLGSALALVAGTHPSPLGGPSLLSGASGAPDASTLRDRRWLIPCLDAVAAEHGKGPLSFDLVDFAAFEGSPAVVIRVIDQQGAKWVWVVGPECGSGGAHTRYRARVG